MNKVFLPTLLVLLMGALMLFTTQQRPPHSFDELLALAQEAAEPRPFFEQAQALLAFQRQTLEGETPALSFSLADRHFRLAEALQARGPQWHDQAIQHYRHAIALQPALRHGWPHFLLAETLLAQNQPEAAIRHYQNVSQYDFGRLRLQAGFRAASLRIRNSTAPLDPQPVHDYLVYASHDIPGEAAYFRNVEWMQDETAHFMLAWLARLDGHAAQALQHLQRYRQSHNTPTARYTLAQWQNNIQQALYPADGNLLGDYYAPRVYAAAQPLLTLDSQLNTVFYVPQPQGQRAQITLEYANPAGQALRFIVTHNADRSTYDAAADASRLVFNLPLSQTRNRLEIYVTPRNPPAQTPQNHWIELHRLQAGLEAMEPAS